MLLSVLVTALLAALLVGCGGGGGGGPAGLPVPSGLTAAPQDGAVQLSWNAVQHASLAGYVVTVLVESGALVKRVDVPAAETMLLVEGLENGAAYSFTVMSEDSNGTRSAESAPVVATPAVPVNPPLTPTGLTALAQDRQVLLTWDAGAEQSVALYRLHYGVAGGPLASQLEVAGDATSVMVPALDNGVAYQFALEAQNEAGQLSPRTAPVPATPQANLAAPQVLSVAITGYGDSTQLRQGAGAIEVVVTGERLADLTAARVLGTFDLQVAEATATSARLTGVEPHGLETGLRTLVVSAPGGEHAVADALEVTKIVAAKTPGLNPSDTTGTGTPNLPFLTLSKALSVAAAGDTVLLGAGTYAAGENWPNGGVTPVANVPAGVTIEGMSTDRGAVLLDGQGAASTDGLAFGGSVTVRNLSIRGFRYAMFAALGTGPARQGEVILQNVAVFDNLAGLWVQYADSLRVEECAFRNNSVGSASGWGLLVQGVRNVELQATEVIGNHVGLRLTTVAGAPSTATLTGLSVTTNASDGVRVTSVSTILRETRIAGNSGDGLRLEGAPPQLHVGAGTVLEANSGFQLADLRDANQGTYPVSRYALPGSGLTIGPYLGPAEVANVYRIANAGNGFLLQ